MASVGAPALRRGRRRRKQGRVETGTVTYTVSYYASAREAAFRGFLEGLGSVADFDLFGEQPLHLCLYDPPYLDALTSLHKDWLVLEQDLGHAFEHVTRKALAEVQPQQDRLFDADTLEPNQ